MRRRRVQSLVLLPRSSCASPGKLGEENTETRDPLPRCMRPTVGFRAHSPRTTSHIHSESPSSSRARRAARISAMLLLALFSSSLYAPAGSGNFLRPFSRLCFQSLRCPAVQCEIIADEEDRILSFISPCHVWPLCSARVGADGVGASEAGGFGVNVAWRTVLHTIFFWQVNHTWMF